MKKRQISAKAVKSFENQLINNERSRNTVEKYLRDIRHFAAFAAQGSIDKALVLAYKASLERNYTLTSANSMLAAINSFFRFMDWNDLCVKQFPVQKKTYCSEDSELTKQEYLALVRTARQKQNRRLSLLLQAICGTGIRVSELEFITVEAVRRGEAVVTCKGKTRKVFLVRDLCQKLLRYVKEQGIPSGAVFVTKTGKPVNRSNIWREMKALCVQAGVNPSKVFPHNLRHLFARTFYGMEKDIAKLADILGHTSINTTRIYIISTGREHRRKLENLHLIL